MPDPRQAPEAVSGVFRQIEDVAGAAHLTSQLWLSPVVAANGTPADEEQMVLLAQRSFGPPHRPHVVRGCCEVRAPQEWWQVFHHEVTEGLLVSAHGSWCAGDLALTAADLIEAHLGPVRQAARLTFEQCTCCDVATSTLLLVSGAWATVLYLGVSD